jgi:hypothetical protein
VIPGRDHLDELCDEESVGVFILWCWTIQHFEKRVEQICEICAIAEKMSINGEIEPLLACSLCKVALISPLLIASKPGVES